MFKQPIVIGAFKSEEDIFRYIKGIDLLVLMMLAQKQSMGMEKYSDCKESDGEFSICRKFKA